MPSGWKSPSRLAKISEGESSQGQLHDLRVVCSQPLLSASQGRLAAGDGEGKNGPD